MSDLDLHTMFRKVEYTSWLGLSPVLISGYINVWGMRHIQEICEMLL